MMTTVKKKKKKAILVTDSLRSICNLIIGVTVILSPFFSVQCVHSGRSLSPSQVTPPEQREGENRRSKSKKTYGSKYSLSSEINGKPNKQRAKPKYCKNKSVTTSHKESDVEPAPEQWLLWQECFPSSFIAPCGMRHKVSLGSSGSAVPSVFSHFLPTSACSLLGQSEKQSKFWQCAITGCVTNTVLVTDPKHSSNMQAIGKKLTPSQPDPACSFISGVSFPSLPPSFPSAAIYCFLSYPLAHRACLFSYHIPLMTFQQYCLFKEKFAAPPVHLCRQAGRRGEVGSHLNIFLNCVG